MRAKGTKRAGPEVSRAAKAVVAAAVPVMVSALLWAQTGSLDEAEMSVALSGLLTALIVYFVPNDPGEGVEDRDAGR